MQSIGIPEEDAYAVLFPAFEDLKAPRWLGTAIEQGTRFLLLAESRLEYLNREMTHARRTRESVSTFSAFTSELRKLSRDSLVLAVDQEPWGIRRLHDLVPNYEDPSNLEAFEESVCHVASTASSLGIDLFLSPVLDKLRGENPWLESRSLNREIEDITTLGAAYIRLTQKNGVLTAAKHFPGFPELTTDPALEDTSVRSGDWDLELLIPFKAAIESGARIIMLGPAVVADVDGFQPASTSARTVAVLRNKLHFRGVIMSDILDSPATSRGRSIPATAIDAIGAGVNLLLVPGGDQLAEIVDAISKTARADSAFRSLLFHSARKVKGLADSSRH